MPDWILPENISDVLPNEARQIEFLRHQILGLFTRYGYALVIPPLIEYVESLITDEDSVLDLKTFKFMDQLSGRQLGLRADITPQVARIDAHLLNRPGVTRLCYAASTVNTLPAGILSSREPKQLGAEIYGCADTAADVEVIELMMASLQLANVKGLHLDIGHIGLFYALINAAKASSKQREAVFNALQQKDMATLTQLVKAWPEPLAQGILALPDLYGDASVLDEAKAKLPDLPGIHEALQTLNEVFARLNARGISVNFDLTELRSSFYHTGLVFAVYAPGWPNAIARGGRYDNIGARFGRARAATGFSLDLRELTGLPYPAAPPAILAPNDESAQAAIRALREQGEVVIVDLLQTGDVKAYFCDRLLQQVDGVWQVVIV